MELYDLQTDPLEMTNLAGRPVVKRTLSGYAQARAWMKEQGDKGVETELKPEPRVAVGKRIILRRNK